MRATISYHNKHSWESERASKWERERAYRSRELKDRRWMFKISRTLQYITANLWKKLIYPLYRKIFWRNSIITAPKKNSCTTHVTQHHRLKKKREIIAPSSSRQKKKIYRRNHQKRRHQSSANKNSRRHLHTTCSTGRKPTLDIAQQKATLLYGQENNNALIREFRVPQIIVRGNPTCATHHRACITYLHTIANHRSAIFPFFSNSSWY